MVSPPATRALSSHDFPTGCIDRATKLPGILFNDVIASPVMVSLIRLMLLLDALRLVA